MVKNCWFWDQISVDVGWGVINWSDAYNTFFIVYDTAITNRDILNTNTHNCCPVWWSGRLNQTICVRQLKNMLFMQQWVNKTWYSFNSLEITGSLFNVHVCGIGFCLESITVASIEYGQLLAKCLYQCKRPFELWILFYIVLCNKCFPLNHLPDKVFPYGSIGYEYVSLHHCKFTVPNSQKVKVFKSRQFNHNNHLSNFPLSQN